MTLSCFYRTDHEFFIFWKQFSLALKDAQIKKFTRQREFPLAMASGRVEFSSPVKDCKFFSYQSVLSHGLAAQKNRLIVGSFENPQHMFWLRKKMINVLVSTLNTQW